FEMRGRRRVQAWENLKKMRGLVRRVQNRGYATLARIADHIDSLTAGDESNAVLEAIDAVNLMTVHASKGLEFPVVFIVNMARGAGGLPKPVRVIVDGEGGAPSVSVSPFVSETDELERAREQHETRRLLYVATTRARDRLYLSSSLKDGQMAAGRGGLADVLPHSMRPLFAAAAATSDETVMWMSASGRAFTWRVCRPVQGADGPGVIVEADAELQRDLVAPLVATAREPRVSASEWLRRFTDDDPRASPGSTQDALVGSLVHRLFQARAEESDDLLATAGRLVRATERAVTEDVEAVTATAVAIWRSMRTRDDVRPLLEGVTVLTEVPFSLRVSAGGQTEVVRGTIDCLVEGADGAVTILEFKTGCARVAHQAQLDLYVRAARALFPGTSVTGRLIYAGP
ncbi:MAG: PD-(D/E)XK nuclease family protein, partial [Acidobacteria bacterium]|nr:PD-(D/E)XK nuclease family protein [Acidobacteriota bacterium]